MYNLLTYLSKWWLIRLCWDWLLLSVSWAIFQFITSLETKSVLLLDQVWWTHALWWKCTRCLVLKIWICAVWVFSPILWLWYSWLTRQFRLLGWVLVCQAWFLPVCCGCEWVVLWDHCSRFLIRCSVISCFIGCQSLWIICGELRICTLLSFLKSYLDIVQFFKLWQHLDYFLAVAGHLSDWVLSKPHDFKLW